MKSIKVASAWIALGGSAFAQQAPDCPNGANVAKLTELQGNLADQLRNDNAMDVLQKLDDCYGSRDKVPACLQRAYATAENRLARRALAPEKVDNEIDMRRPPEPMLATSPNSNDKLMRLFQTDPEYKDAEKIAKENGWPVVRYKSRHSGGFDPGTPSLLMIYVPGSKMTPPVDYDRWINIALPADAADLVAGAHGTDLGSIPTGHIPTPADYSSDNPMPRTTTIMTVQQGHGGAKSRVFFSKYHRVEGGLWAGESFNPIRDCISCHPNGMRAISPLGFNVNATQADANQIMDPAMWKAVRDINGAMDTIQNHGTPDWGQFKDVNGKLHPLLNPLGQGPLYGPMKPLKRTVVTNDDGTKRLEFPTRQKKYILGDDGHSGCANQQKTYQLQDIFGRATGRDNNYTMKDDLPIDWKKVAKKMDCAQCHNGETHGALTSSTDFDTIAYKILVDQSMPLWDHTNPGDTASTGHPGHVGDDLNLNERIALVSCLRQEFSDSESRDLKAWYSQDTCKAVNNQATNGSGGDQGSGSGAAGAGGGGDNSGVHSAD